MFSKLSLFIKNNIKQEKINFQDRLNININEVLEIDNNIYQKYVVNNNYDINKLTDIYSNYIKNFEKYYVIKSKLKDNFFEAILNIIHHNFLHYELKIKKNIISKFRKYLSYELANFLKENNNLSKKFGKRSNLQGNMLNFKKTLVGDDNIKKLICNFLDINIYIFELSDYKIIDNVDILYSEKDIITRYKPTIYLQYWKNRYDTIVHNNFKIFTFSDKIDSSLEDLYNHLEWEQVVKEITELEVDLNKMKVVELRAYAESLNINIKKPSTKTKKMIYKTKKELIENIRDI